MVNKKIIFYELNEVPPRLFDFYSKAFPMSSFADLMKYGSFYKTISEDFGHLSPWITWPSVHRGVNNIQHEIGELGQDLSFVNRDFPPLWEILANNGVKVGVFGPLHSHPLPSDLNNYAFYVPDTFAAGPECFPSQLSPFQEFNLSMVAKNGKNVSSSIALRSASRFLLAAPNLGLRGRTLAKLGAQVVSEKLKKDRLVRRRTSQVQIAFDIFLNELKTKKPEASFFFTNHVASSLHRYWPSLFPQDYNELKFDRSWLERWHGEIPHTMGEANCQIRSLMDLVDSDDSYELIVLSSMGQEAVQGVSEMRNQVLITHVSKLMSYLGLTLEEWDPHLAMQPRQVVTIKSDNAMKKFSTIKDLRINGNYLDVKELGMNQVAIDINLANVDQLSISCQNRFVNGGDIGIDVVDLQDAAGSNAYHVPEGSLVTYSGRLAKKQQGPETISTLSVAPSTLNNYGLSIPSYMQGDQTILM